MNQCIHNIDLLRWMMGDEVEEVMAYTDQLGHPYLEAEDMGMGIVKLEYMVSLKALPIFTQRIWKRHSIFLERRERRRRPEQVITL